MQDDGSAVGYALPMQAYLSAFARGSSLLYTPGRRVVALGHASWIYDKQLLEVPVQLLLCNDLLAVAVLKDGRGQLAIRPLSALDLEVSELKEHWEEDLLHVSTPDQGELTLSFASSVELSRWHKLLTDKKRLCPSSELHGASLLKRTPRSKMELAELLQQGNPYETDGRALIERSFKSVAKVCSSSPLARHTN